MSEPQPVEVSIEDGVAVLTIANPPANSLDTPTLDQLERAFDQAIAQHQVKVVIITGQGRFAFSAGADIKELAAFEDAQAARAFALKGQRLLDKIEASSKPVIAAINGYCLGGGNELAMACHLRIASERAQLGQPEIDLGLIPSFGAPQRLPRTIPRGKAYELLLTGERLDAEAALPWGLVNQVVLADQLLDKTLELAGKTASKGRVAVISLMEAMREGSKTDLERGLAIEAERFGALFETQDTQEGLTAFLEKRQPQFRDR